MPLRYSVAVRSVDVIRLLLATGADPAFETHHRSLHDYDRESRHCWL
ncbi:hypothetical protein [Mesorhizobium sp. M0047]